MQQVRADVREQYQARLLDMVEDGVVGTDEDFCITEWNLGAEHLYGYTAEEVLGLPANQVATFTGDPQRERLERELLEEGRSRLEITAVRRDGIPVEIEIVVTAVRDDAGAVTGYLGIHRDVTEQRRAARRLEQLSGMIGNARDFIGFADLDGRVVSVNDAGLRLTGLHDGAGAQGRDLVEFVAEHDRVRARDDVLPGVMRDGHRVEQLDLHDFTGGAPVPVSCHAFRVDDPVTGRPLGVATISRDLRENDSLRRAEQQAELARLGARSSHAADLGVFLDDAVSRIGRAVGADFALVAELTSAADRLVVRAGAGLEHRSTMVVGTSDAGDLFGRALSAGAAVVADDVLRGGSVEVAPALRALRPAGCAVVPLGGGEDVYGALAVFSRASQRFTPPDVDFLETAAHVLSAAIERSRTAQRLEQARDVERRRIARALHDEALEDLCYALERAEAPPDGSKPDEPLVQALTRIGRELRSAVYGVRLDASGAPIRVLLVEDHAAVREAVADAFRHEPDFGVVGEAATLAEAREMLDEVDVALVDLGLPDGDGGDLIAALREANPDARAVVLSAGLDRSAVARAVERGAVGALAKSDRLPDVIDAVRRVHAGETLLPLEEVIELLRFAGRQRERELLDRRAIESLTSRELEVLQLIADGCDSRQAASRLHISLRTQRNHVANILGKLGVHSQLQALIFALRYQLVELRSTAY
jgi:PAS domain S-box-containing protein